MSAPLNVTKEIKAAMRRSGYNHVQLAAALGCSRQNVREWGMGRVPLIKTAARLAELLAEPRILQAALVARTVHCETCGAACIAETYRRRYCSDACQSVAHTLGRRAMSEAEVTLVRDLRTHRAAIEDMCRSCEPDGVCRMAECPLRSVSPFALADARPGPVPPRNHGWTDARRRQSSLVLRRQWKDGTRNRRPLLPAA